MENRNLVRDSLIIFAIVILFVYASALAFSLLVGAKPSDQLVGNIALIVVMYLAVLGLGLVLWRSEAAQSGS